MFEILRKNLAEIFKKQTDEILRLQRLNKTGAVVITGNPTPGEPPAVNNPVHDLNAHKTADDHSDYLTAGRHDALDHTGLPGVGGGAFTELTDVPASYTDQAGKIPAVNSTETGLEFVDAPTGSGGGSGLFDLGKITDATTTSQDWGTVP